MEDWKDKLAKLGQDLQLSENSDKSDKSDKSENAEISEIHKPASPSKKETLHIVVEKKGRKGKTATIIEGFGCDDSDLADIARTLRQKIGVGGSSRGGEILLQGDCREKAAAILKSMDYKLKN